jgi:hypothetical protein
MGCRRLQRRRSALCQLAFYGTSSDESKTLKPVMIQMLSEKIQKALKSQVSPVAAAPGAARASVAVALATTERSNESDAAVAAAAIRAIPPEEPME